MLSKIKKIIIALATTVTSAMAQTPDMINYQGVAQNANGTAIANQAIKVRLKVHNTTAAGTVQYSEVRNVTTDASGLFNIQIGSAGAVSTTGSWAGITWATGAKFLQVEMDPTGGTTYTNMGTQQLVSVPYAQHAKSAASLSSGATVTPSQIATAGATNNQVLQFNGTNWAPANVAAGSSFNLPYAETDSTTVPMLNITNKYGSGIKATTITSIASIVGLSTGTAGIGLQGESNLASGIGVHGTSASGTGLKGYSNSNTGVFGSTLTGIALRGFSLSGYGLDVNGKVKIAGGNTNPGNGKVLTSDSQGNAVWKDKRIAFSCSGIVPNGLSNIAHATSYKAHFNTVDFDYGNGYVNSTGTPSSTYTVSVSGVYSLSAVIFFGRKLNSNNDYIRYTSTSVKIMIKHNGATSSLITSYKETFPGSEVVFDYASIAKNVHLVAGDQVWVEVEHRNEDFTTMPLSTGNAEANFSGALLFAD